MNFIAVACGELHSVEMNDDYNEFGEVERASCQPHEDMTVLDQLQVYQLINRTFAPLLEAYEIVVLNQILDRTIGWRKHKAIFTAQRLYEGDTVYGGLERTMHRSKMMSALKRLEDRGLIRREVVAGGTLAKAYSINFGINLQTLERLAPAKRKSYKRGVSIYISSSDNEHLDTNETASNHVVNRDNIVSPADYLVSIEDKQISIGDPREEYREKGISLKNTIRTARSVPAEPTALLKENFLNQGEMSETPRSFPNPPPRKRRALKAPQN